MFIYILTHVCDDPGLPRWLSEEESACQRRRHSFHPWSGKIPHASKQVNRWATAIKAVLWRPWSWCPTRGAATVRKPNAAAKSGPHSLPPGKQTKNKQIIKKKKKTANRHSARFADEMCSVMGTTLLPYKTPGLEQLSPSAGWTQWQAQKMVGPRDENTRWAPEGSCGAGSPCSPLQLSYKLGKIYFLS